MDERIVEDGEGLQPHLGDFWFDVADPVGGLAKVILVEKDILFNRVNPWK